MKKNFLFAMAMAAVFAGCSSDDDGTETGQKGSKGFMTFNVELPSVSTTRAANDVFEEGDDAEYAVNDVTICLLNDAGTILQVESSTPSWTDQGSDGKNVQRISSTIEVKTEQEPTKVLVVLNNKNNLSLTKGTNFENALLSTKTASDFIADRIANEVAKGITMTNAAIVGNSTINTLTPIDASTQICNTQAEALANPVEVYVERIVAKVSVSGTNTFTTGIPAGMTSITLNNWELDITNTATYPLRKTDDAWLVKDNFKSDHPSYTAGDLNRMIGTATAPQRVYWAIDANYQDADKTDGSYTNGFNNIAIVDNDLTDVDYCLENTFDIMNQTQDQTTRVVFKATIAPDATGYNTGDNFFTKGNSSDIWTIDALATEISTIATSEGVFVGTSDISVLTNATAGKLTLNETNLSTLLGAAIDATTAKTISDKLGEISCFEDGICYYVARIMHFGEDLTPWTVSDERYNSDNKKWLGRYGVVRNNWYELNVTGIKKLGTPTIPTPEKTPDDEVEKYMVYKINILSWAKRSQDVEL